MAKVVIFLDFDGVLCDSVKEAYILSRYAYYGIDVYEQIEIDKYSIFSQCRYLISNSWQYFLLMQILKEHPEYNTDAIEIRFNILVQEREKKNEQIERFNKLFLAKRSELIEQNFKFWNSLETPTLFLKRLKNILHNTSNCTFAILSTKNKEAIIKKFGTWNIKFDSNFIFEKNDLGNLTKGAFIDMFMKSHPEFDNSILIDDNEENIESCTNIANLRAYLTNWGYISNPQNAKSEAEILKLIKEEL